MSHANRLSRRARSAQFVCVHTWSMACISLRYKPLRFLPSCVSGKRYARNFVHAHSVCTKRLPVSVCTARPHDVGARLVHLVSSNLIWLLVPADWSKFPQTLCILWCGLFPVQDRLLDVVYCVQTTPGLSDYSQ